MLDRVNAHVIGAVMNKVRAASGSYYYGYGNNSTSSSNGSAKLDKHETEQAELEKRTTKP
jgi:hypothetical protein